MEDWRYDNAVVTGLLMGVIAYMGWSWVAASSTTIGNALLQLAGTALAGGSFACAAVFLQRGAAKRANDRHEHDRRIRISYERNSRR